MLGNVSSKESLVSVLRLLASGAVICGLLVAVCGCEQLSGPSIVQIIGEVKMGRKPLADAFVAAVPLEPRGPSGKITELAFGKTDDAGRFELRTSAVRGVLPGEYRVLFFRPSAETDMPAQIDDTVKEKLESELTGIDSDTSWMLDAIDRFDASLKTSEKGSTAINVGDVPLAHNVKSALRLTVKPGAGIIYPKFELDAHPKN